MFKKFYTTGMSGDARVIARRFARINSDNGGRIAAAVMSAAMLASMCIITAAAAGVDNATQNERIEVLYNGSEIIMQNTPFVDNQEVYVPLRETLNICGINDISYDNGTVGICFASQTGIPINAEIHVGERDIYFDTDADSMWYNRTPYTASRTTTHPVILKDGVTYVPTGMLIRIRYYDLPNPEDNHAKIYAHLIDGLEIRQYTGGKYNAVLSAPIDVNGEDKYNPKSYYNSDENVIIGTAEEFDSDEFNYTEVNGYYYPENAVKRILVDDEGRVKLIVTADNQKHERLNPAMGGYYSWNIRGVTDGHEETIFRAIETETGSRCIDRFYVADELWVQKPKAYDIGGAYAI